MVKYRRCFSRKTMKSATDLLKQKNEEFLAQKRAIMKQKKLDAVKALDEKIKQQALKKAANGQSNPGNDKLIISGGPPSGSPSIFAKLGAGRGPRPGPNTPEAAKLKAARILQAQRQPKNPKTEKEKILERVKQNRMTKEEKKVEENKESEFMGKKMSKTDAKGKVSVLQRFLIVTHQRSSGPRRPRRPGSLKPLFPSLESS